MKSIFSHALCLISTDHIYTCFHGTDHCNTESQWLYLCIKQTCEIPCKRIFDEDHALSWYSWCSGGVLDGTCNCKICYKN
jgi:hypothetical protein